MTKTLTEKWKDGELELGTYWIVGSDGVEYIDFLLDKSDFNMITDVKEVLAPVPSYEEYKNLQEENNKLADLITDINNKWLKTIKEKKKLEKQVKMVEVKGKVK